MLLFNVFRVQFVKREPIFIASDSFASAIESLMKDPNLCPEKGDEIIGITHTPNHVVFV